MKPCRRKELVGEIWPIEVNSFEPTPFTYVVLPTLNDDNAGFDRLEILTHVQAHAVRAVRIDGQPVDLDAFVPDLLARSPDCVLPTADG